MAPCGFKSAHHQVRSSERAARPERNAIQPHVRNRNRLIFILRPARFGLTLGLDVFGKIEWRLLNGTHSRVIWTFSTAI